MLNWTKFVKVSNLTLVKFKLRYVLILTSIRYLVRVLVETEVIFF